jgi:glucan phosphoethanolaminetransferase (alkaline phosphatase superfamily)
MKLMRKVWGWFFGMVALVFLCVSVMAFRLVNFHQFGASFRRQFILSGCMIVFALVFGKAWWTEFKGKLSARAWGIAPHVWWLLSFHYSAFITSTGR